MKFDQFVSEDLIMSRYIQDKIFKDPVCDMEVSFKTAADLFTYERKTYYFCANSCRDAFAADPEKYIHHHRQRGVKRR